MEGSSRNICLLENARIAMMSPSTVEASGRRVVQP